MEYIFGEGGQFLARWIHFMAGVVWIGLLYYFNFVQGSFFNEIDASNKSVAIQKLVPRALWWFRYGALFTFLSGAYILTAKGSIAGHEIFLTPWGRTIAIGAILGTLMFLNVWLIIWPNQKIVIQSTTQVASGGQALPEAAAAGAKASLASRTNVLFSIPMLFMMGAASHYPLIIDDSKRGLFWAVTLLIIAALEFNAVKGKMGPMTTVKGVIHSGVALTAVFYIVARIFWMTA